MTGIIEYLFRGALKQILKNQLVLMETMFSIAMALSHIVEPGYDDDLRSDACDMVSQYTPTKEYISKL